MRNEETSIFGNYVTENLTKESTTEKVKRQW